MSKDTGFTSLAGVRAEGETPEAGIGMAETGRFAAGRKNCQV